MIADDLFKEFDDAAAERGWKRQFTKDMRFARRYDHGDYTVRVWANRGGLGISRASISYQGYQRTSLISKHPGKRATVISWLRFEFLLAES